MKARQVLVWVALAVAWVAGVEAGIAGLSLASWSTRDDASLVMEAKAGEGVAATEILTMWGRSFGAQVIPDPQIVGIKIRFADDMDTPMTWGTVKALLKLHDIVVVEDRPTPERRWVIRAHERRNLVQVPCHAYRRSTATTAVFQISFARAGEVAAVVTKLFQTLGGRSCSSQRTTSVLISRRPPQGCVCGLTRVIADPLTNQLVVVTDPMNVSLLEEVVSALDAR